MTLKDRMTFLTTPEQVDQFLAAHKTAAIFKAGTCHKTPTAFEHVQAQLEDREDLPLGIIRVVEARAASNHVEKLTAVRHESPQLLLFKDGKPVFDRDNWDITAEAVAEGLEDFVRVAAGPPL
jgi:bacillithiol system protein YtxJ